MKFLFRYIKPFTKIMLVGFLIKCTGTLIELALPYILSHILDDVVPNDGRLSMIILWGGVMIACSLIALVCNVKANRMASKVARDCTEQIRHDLFYRTMTLSGRQIDAFTVPSLESRITTDTYNVQDFIGKIQRLGVRAPLLLLGGIIVTLVTDALTGALNRKAFFQICGKELRGRNAYGGASGYFCGGVFRFSLGRAAL